MSSRMLACSLGSSLTIIRVGQTAQARSSMPLDDYRTWRYPCENRKMRPSSIRMALLVVVLRRMKVLGRAAMAPLTARDTQWFSAPGQCALERKRWANGGTSSNGEGSAGSAGSALLAVNWAALAAGRARNVRAAKAPSQVEPAMRPTAMAILARLQVPGASSGRLDSGEVAGSGYVPGSGAVSALASVSPFGRLIHEGAPNVNMVPLISSFAAPGNALNTGSLMFLILARMLLVVRMHRPKQAEAMARPSIRATMHRATHPRMAPREERERRQ